MRILFVWFGIILLILAAVVSGTLLVGRFLALQQGVSSSDWAVFESAPSLGWDVSMTEQAATQTRRWDIYMTHQQTGQVRQLTDHFANDRFPVLSPDNQRVAFVSWRDNNPEVYVLEIGSGVLHDIFASSCYGFLSMLVT
jgi:hypothetical protein